MIFGMNKIYMDQRKAAQYHSQIAFYKMLNETIEKRRKEREQLEERITKSSKDKVEISKDGKVLLKENADGDDSTVTVETKADFTDMSKEPVAYTQTGEVVNLTEQKTNISVSL